MSSGGGRIRTHSNHAPNTASGLSAFHHGARLRNTECSPSHAFPRPRGSASTVPDATAPPPAGARPAVRGDTTRAPRPSAQPTHRHAKAPRIARGAEATHTSSPASPCRLRNATSEIRHSSGSCITRRRKTSARKVVCEGAEPRPAQRNLSAIGANQGVRRKSEQCHNQWAPLPNAGCGADGARFLAAEDHRHAEVSVQRLSKTPQRLWKLHAPEDSVDPAVLQARKGSREVQQNGRRGP